MILNKDYFDNPIIPDYVLCKANKERIGTLKCTEKTIDVKYNELNEVHFTTYMNIDGEQNPYYDAIDIVKYILLPNIGFFCISDCSLQSEGTEFEYKKVTAKSYECLLAQKYIENFVINKGSVGSIDGCQFYNLADKEHSLLHRILSKCPDWKIGHIDTALVTMQRSFEIDRQDIYSFLMKDVATMFECVFLFDTLTNTINIYQEKNVGEDTDIHVSYNNLLKSTDISCSLDDIKTCLTITGAEDLNIREVNLGNDRFINVNAFNSTEYMSEGLYNAYNAWVKLQNENKPQYTSLLSQYQNYYTQINELTYTKMPSDSNSTDWTLYGLNPLKEKLTVYEQKQAVSMKAGHGEPSSSFYESEYLPIYNTINDINSQIKKVNSELESLKSLQDKIGSQMSDIIKLVSMENNFSEEQLKELSTFIREDELNSDNFVVTDIMTDEERFDMLEQMLDFGEKELEKKSTPQLSFSVDMVNIFAIPGFEKLYGKFDVGNYIWVTLRDDYHIKARLLTMHINFHDATDFSVQFGNILKKAKTRYRDVSERIKNVESIVTSVSFNSSYWSQAYENATNVVKMLDEGLLSQKKYLTDNPDNSELFIDSRGIFVNTTSGEYTNKDSIFIGGGRILFTDDAWKTVAMAVGRANVNGESRFGVFADFCIAAYIAGSIIVGGTLTSDNYQAGKYGTHIDLTDGTFEFNGGGEKKLYFDGTTLTAKGTIQTTDGWFGGENGFKISNGKAYTNNKSSLNSANAGVYLGTDGISLGANSPFKVDSNGKLVASNVEITKGTIGGITIENNSLHSANGRWYINSDGSSSFTTPYIGGVQNGSSFGGVNVGTNGDTFGSFNNGFNADTSFSVTGGALQNFNDLVANKVTAAYIDATVQLSANYATINSLNAVSARVGTIEANYVTTNYLSTNYLTASSIKADYMEVANWVEAGYIKAGKINADNITVGTLSVNRIADMSKTGSAYWKKIEFLKELDYVNFINVRTADTDVVQPAIAAIGFLQSSLYVLAGSDISVTSI